MKQKVHVSPKAGVWSSILRMQRAEHPRMKQKVHVSPKAGAWSSILRMQS
jgi:hypothetical protein